MTLTYERNLYRVMVNYCASYLSKVISYDNYCANSYRQRTDECGTWTIRTLQSCFITLAACSGKRNV